MINDPTPSWQQLVDWIEGRLSPADAATVEQLVALAGDSIAADVAWIRAFVHAGDEVVMDEPPAALRSALRASYDEYASARMSEEGIRKSIEDGPNILQRLVAVLTVDSGLQPGLVGARAAEADGVRQLIYSTRVLDISLSVRHETDGLYVNGQILPIRDLDLGAFRAFIQQGDDVVADSSVDAHGLFSFAAIDADTYQFYLRTEELSVWIESLDLRE